MTDAPTTKEARPELCPICIARSQHGPPIATELRFVTRERDEARREMCQMQTVIDDLRAEVAAWRDERNHIAEEWRSAGTVLDAELEHERDLLRDVALRLWNEVEYPEQHRDLAVSLGFVLSMTGDRELTANRGA